jgi:hypothetical protein
MDADAPGSTAERNPSDDGETERSGRRRRFVAWYGEWYLTLYAVLATAIGLGATYGYVSGALSWWNAGGMVATLVALSGFVRWRLGVDAALDPSER